MLNLWVSNVRDGVYFKQLDSIKVSKLSNLYIREIDSLLKCLHLTSLPPP